MPKRFRQITTCLLMALALFLSGCAAKKLIVRNADSLLEHQLTKRMPLYTKQRSDLSRDIDKFLKEHKTDAEELIPLVDSINLDNKEEIKSQYKQLSQYYDKVAKSFSGMLAKHMAQLDSKQQKEFFETLADENRDIKAKDADERMDQIEERFETFFGSINEEQKQLFANHKDYFSQRNEQRLIRRINLHKEFARIYSADLSREAMERSFLEAYEKYQKDGTNHEKQLSIINEFLPTITKNQKEFFRTRVDDVKELLKYFIDVDY